MHDEQIAEILKRFGLRDYAVSPPQKGYRNTSYKVVSNAGIANLIIFKREAQALATIRRADKFSHFLHEQGMPVRFRKHPPLLQIYGGTVPQYAGLYNYLPGATIPWEAYTKKHLKALGRSLAQLHQLARVYDADDRVYVHQTMSTLIDTIERYCNQAGVRSAAKQKLGVVVEPKVYDRFRRLAAALGESTQQQWLHMDFVRGNILFSPQAHVCGIIDFEKASFGHPLFDVARTLAFLLVDCAYKEPQDVYRLFLEHGYQGRGRNLLPAVIFNGVDRTSDVLEALTAFYMLHDYYKFLLYSPYESLGQNHHFTCTKAELLKRNVLTEI